MLRRYPLQDDEEDDNEESSEDNSSLGLNSPLLANKIFTAPDYYEAARLAQAISRKGQENKKRKFYHTIPNLPYSIATTPITIKHEDGPPLKRPHTDPSPCTQTTTTQPTAKTTPITTKHGNGPSLNTDPNPCTHATILTELIPTVLTTSATIATSVKVKLEV